MSRHLKLLLVCGVIVSAGLFGCRKRTADRDAPAKLVQRQSPVGAINALPSRAEQSYALKPFARIGLPECDTYLVKYRACLQSRVPPADRERLASSLQQTAQAWRQAARSDDSRIQLKATCEMASAAAKSVMEHYGCDW